MIVELAIRRSWSHIFCLCSAMEVSFTRFKLHLVTQGTKLPTFFLGWMTLYPEFRSNIVFAVAFFFTRILFHIVLGVSYFLHDNRTQATGGSYIPSLLLASIFPVHAMWFHGCIKGFFRRASKRNTPITPISTIAELDILPVDSTTKVSSHPEPESSKPAVPAHSRVENARSMTDSTPSPTPSTYDLKLERSKLHSRRFYSRSMSLSSGDSKSSVTGILRTKLYASLPNREVVFDYVGLGRASAQQEQ